jgi:hypothetical protein
MGRWGHDCIADRLKFQECETVVTAPTDRVVRLWDSDKLTNSQRGSFKLWSQYWRTQMKGFWVLVCTVLKVQHQCWQNQQILRRHAALWKSGDNSETVRLTENMLIHNQSTVRLAVTVLRNQTDKLFRKKNRILKLRKQTVRSGRLQWGGIALWGREHGALTDRVPVLQG